MEGGERKVGEWEEVREGELDCYAKLKNKIISSYLVGSLAMRM